MKSDLRHGSDTFRTVFLTVIIYCAVVIGFTVLAVLLGPRGAQIGTTRPTDTIPSHLAELAGAGLLLGLGSVIIYGRRELHLIILSPVLTVLLDLDHLPAYLGMSETIRPAHSLLFIPVVLAIMAITIKRLDIDLVVLSATLAHMGIDTGLFAPFSPLSFHYIELDPYSVPFLAGAFLAALAAGIALRHGGSKQDGVGGLSNE